MDVASLRAEMEQDQAWRQAEVRSLQNQLAGLIPQLPVAPVSLEGRLRRALVLLLYAHFEGYTKFAFTVYVNAINTAGLRCKDANIAVAAGSLSEVFAALRDPSSKCSEFKGTLPNDGSLHLLAREREFLERIMHFEQKPVHVPLEIADPESNLKPIVLRKILYRLGFPHDAFEDIEGDIHKLLNYRNKIAHGEPGYVLSESEYQKLRDSVFWVMGEVTRKLTRALHSRRFARH